MLLSLEHLERDSKELDWTIFCTIYQVYVAIKQWVTEVLAPKKYWKIYMNQKKKEINKVDNIIWNFLI